MLKNVKNVVPNILQPCSLISKNACSIRSLYNDFRLQFAYWSVGFECDCSVGIGKRREGVFLR